MKISFTLLLLLISIFCSAQINLTSIEKTINEYGQYEKIYVQTDRNYFTAGGDIFFKVYLTNQTLSLEKAKSKVAYIDLISPDQQIIETKTIAIQKGQGKGDFKITSRFKSGHYTIRAYTRYMKNFDTAFFYRKSVYIRGVSNLEDDSEAFSTRFNIHFFPEGGDLVENLSSKIGIKAIDAYGMGISINGKIIDNNNQEIQQVATNEKGFGEILFTPQPNQSYSFEGIYNGEQLEIPMPVLKEGAVLSIDNSNTETILIQVITNIPNAMNQGFLIGQAMGKVFFKEALSNQTLTTFDIDVASIPFGILHFTLFDNLGQPRAERIVFNHDGIDNFNIDISSNKKSYGKREKVALKLDLFDDDGETITADISLTVVDNYLQKANLNSNNIQSYLLLSSDIKGRIENPTHFFKDSEASTRKALDLLLMTQGWRRFSWQDVLQNPNKKIEFPPEQSLSIQGKITKKNDVSKSLKAVGYLSELSTNLSMVEFETDENGQFNIENLTATDGAEMVIQAATLNKKQKKVKKGNFALKGDRNIDIIIAGKEKIPIDKDDKINYNIAKQQKEAAQSLTNLENINYKNDLAYDDLDWSIDIDSIEVTGQKIDKIIEYYEDAMLYKRPDTRIKLDEVTVPNAHNNILSILIGKVPGMKLDGGSIIFRGEHSGLSSASARQTAKFMINGAFVSEESVLSLDPGDIAFVDVLRSLSKLAVYGKLGGDGLIMIYLKPPGERSSTKKKKEVKGIVNFTFDGYHQAREFYTPVYEDTNQALTKIDNRVTLHWMPIIQFDELGEAYIEFYTSDRVGIFDILVEGISKDGLPIVGSSKIIVK